jgi:hypothetical protein
MLPFPLSHLVLMFYALVSGIALMVMIVCERILDIRRSKHFFPSGDPLDSRSLRKDP